ncbi:MAG: hypothetical protein ACFCU6_06835 [Balneolaceae bacterium]
MKTSRINTLKHNLQVIKARSVYSELDSNIHRIHSVDKWAELAGVSRSWLNEVMNRNYGKSPKFLIRDKRYEKIISVLRNNPDATGFFVASAAGLRDEKALYKFLSKYHKTNFTRLRLEILNGKPSQF